MNLFFQKALMEQGGADAGVKGDPYISRRVNKWFPHIGNQDKGAAAETSFYSTAPVPVRLDDVPSSQCPDEGERSILHR